jgi:hypothetical protein
VVVVVSLLATTLIAPQAVAAPPVSRGAIVVASGDLDKLNKQISALEKKYGGDMALLRDTQQSAQEALTKSASLGKDLATARSTVAQLAAAQYMGTPLDTSVTVLAAGDPTRLLDTASIASHVARDKSARVAQIQTLINQQNAAARDAQNKIATLKKQLSDMEAQKSRLQQLIKKFKPNSPVVGNTHLTQRLISARNAIDSEWGPFITIGCYRPGDPRDHGVGKACDFMESSGGVMPTAARQAHGDQVAAWCIANASKLGIKYVIWKQRIYDMRSPGWTQMEDRGGITANHFDHVHVSVF